MATIRLTPSLSASFRRLAVSSSASSTSPEPIHAFISSVSSLGWEADRIPLHCSLHSRDPYSPSILVLIQNLLKLSLLTLCPLRKLPSLHCRLGHVHG